MTDIKRTMIASLLIEQATELKGKLPTELGFEDLVDVVQRVVKNCSIPAVSVQSEQLVCSDCADGRDEFEPNWKCPEFRKKDEFNWEVPQLQQRNVGSGDIRIVNLPVKVVFEWSDKIVADYDSETDTVLEYTSGYVMEVLPNQQFVYKDEPTTFIAQTLIDATKFNYKN